MMNHFISLEEDYPYTAKDGVCKVNAKTNEKVKLAGYAKLEFVDENLMKKAIAEFGPVEVSISFLHEKLMRYFACLIV
jgi:Papain family cysteine protease